ncbi:hypothetical protein ABIG06_001731 [Bradyrhizobium sp. USDA 326]
MRGDDDHRVAITQLVEAQALDAIEGRLEIVGPRGRPLAEIPEKRCVRQVTAGEVTVIRAPRKHDTVCARKSDAAVTANVEPAIELQEKGDIDRRESDAGKAAIGMIETSGRRDDPLATGSASHRPSNESSTVGRAAMMLEVFAVAVVEPAKFTGSLVASQRGAITRC